MLNEQTMEKMNAMKLAAMAEAFEQQLSSSEHAKLSFEERIGLMVDCEWTAREQRKLTRRLRAAKPRYRSASLEDVDFKHPRGLKRQQVRIPCLTCRRQLNLQRTVDGRHQARHDPTRHGELDDLRDQLLRNRRALHRVHTQDVEAHHPLDRHNPRSSHQTTS